MVLIVTFATALTTWGIATSKSSKPTPPPVNGIYSNNAHLKQQQNFFDGALFKRIAARFPGGIHQQKDADMKRMGVSRKATMNWLLIAVMFTFVGNSANAIMHALIKRGWWCGQDYVISTVSLFFIYGLLLISQIDNPLSPTLPHFVAWVIGLMGEILLLVARITDFEKHLQKKPPRKRHIKWGSWEIIDISINALRAVLLLLLVGIFLCLFVIPRPPIQQTEVNRDETTGLLTSGNDSNDGEADYGSMPSKSKGNKPTAGWGRRTVVETQSWWEYLRGYAIFFPYLWPSKDRRLQVLMIICFFLVMLQRVVNVLVPHQLGTVADILSGEDGPVRLPVFHLLLYIVYRFLQGNMGVLGSIRSSLWIPIGQYSYQALSTSAFEHVHSLSLDFHLGKKTGEVLSALSKGNAINNFLEQVTFQVVPMLVDLAVAIGYFLVKFDAYYALIVAVVTFCYLYLTIRMAQWRADIRREMVNKSREEDAVKNDSMIAYETVKYFNAEDYEFGRYRDAVNSFQKAEYRVLLSLNIMNISQNLVFTLGLLVACFLSAYQVTIGEAKVGKFVALLTYLAQLQGPLNFFGTFYRSIQSSMINSERMLELFKEKPTVVDKPSAKELKSCSGEIRFNNVEFSYDGRKQALKGLDFIAKPGTTTAFVGESGGGKTTVLRLLFRFYGVQSGSIEVDGRDVEDITINSLREHVGVVPQDTVLFNETVMYNLKYANPSATDEMVFEACKAASIHDKILNFPDGYSTRVGERGLRLSGGEKQRVAIARTILKNPKIILLDEATAALDSETEQHIQAALRELAKGRTTLVIAHRLSTIVNAHQILCMHEGRVAERGTHEELLALGGRYKGMWDKQIRAEKVEKAKAKIDESPNTPVISSSSSSVSNERIIEDDAGTTSRSIAAGANPLIGLYPEAQGSDGALSPSKGKGLQVDSSLGKTGSGSSVWSTSGLMKVIGTKGKILHNQQPGSSRGHSSGGSN